MKSFTVAPKSSIAQYKYYKIYVESVCRNYKTQKTEITDDLNKWRGIPCSYIRSLNIFKKQILHNCFCRFNTILIKSPAIFFVYVNKLILKFI